MSIGNVYTTYEAPCMMCNSSIDEIFDKHEEELKNIEKQIDSTKIPNNIKLCQCSRPMSMATFYPRCDACRAEDRYNKFLVSLKQKLNLPMSANENTILEAVEHNNRVTLNDISNTVMAKRKSSMINRLKDLFWPF